ncbi:MAG: iron-sulfur cluster assembly scaffold protein [Deltaproteobacteria bacterium]|nr:MAG: iron-sulfur cluster assembly scaffold protein [Deltaproteobacteria bacterium]
MSSISTDPDFFQRHSDNYLKMAFCTDYREIFEHPDGYGKRTGHCGDTIEFYIDIENQVMKYVAYAADGCLNTHACANTVAHWMQGKPLEAGWDLTPDQIVAFLETLPDDEHHCAELAAGAFYLALTDATQKRGDASVSETAS